MIKNGVVKWFSRMKGYGFIMSEDGEEVFVHYSALPGPKGQKNVSTGDKVTYDEQERVTGQKFTEDVHTIVRS